MGALGRGFRPVQAENDRVQTLPPEKLAAPNLILVADLADIGDLSRQAVHLVDDHAVDLARLDVGQESLERGPLHVAAGKAAVVIAVGQARPALAGLALDERLAGLALGVERVELLLQALFGGLAGVDGAADDRQRRWRPVPVIPLHASPPFSPRRKKR